MTAILAVLVLAVLFALFGLFMRGRQRECGSSSSCTALGPDGVCPANPEACKLTAVRGDRANPPLRSRPEVTALDVGAAQLRRPVLSRMRPGERTSMENNGHAGQHG